MKITNNKFKIIMFTFIIMISLVLTSPLNVSAQEFPTSIGNIYELRDETSLKGYNGYRRPVGGNSSTYGDYLGKDTQYLPYKIGNAKVETNDAITGYEYAVYCTRFGMASPAKNSYSAKVQGIVAPENCTLSNNWDKGTSAGVAAIIKAAGGSIFAGSSLQNYYDAEIAINQFLYEVSKDECNIDSSKCPGSSISENKITEYKKEWVDKAKQEKALVEMKTQNKLEVHYPASSNLSYDNYAEIWKSERITINNMEHLDDYDSSNANGTLKVVLKDSTGKVYDNYAYITPVSDEKNVYQIGVCNNDNDDNPYCKKISNFEPLTPGRYTVEFVVEGKKVFSLAQNYSCGSSHQGITPAITKEETITEKLERNFSFTVETPAIVKGKIKVSKVDSETGKGLSGAKIRIESKDGSFVDTFNLGNKTYINVDNLDLGEYIITEIEAPDGYELTTKKYSVVLSKDNTYEKVKIENNMLNNSRIVIKKVDSSDHKAVSGAKLQLTDEKGNVIESWTSTENGYEIKELEVGKYYIEEIEAPEGYTLNKNKVEFEIKTKDDQKTIEFNNDKKVKVPDTLSNTSKLLIMLAVSGILVGGILVYKSKFSEDGIK